MAHDTLLALILFAFVSSMTPGPNNAMLLASGVNFGLRRTVPHMLGINAGFFVLMLAAALGLHGVLLAAPLLYQAIRWAGAAYLVYLAWRIATTSPAAEASIADSPARPLTLAQAAAFQAINPKAWIVVATAMTTYARVDNHLSDASIIIGVMVVFAAVSVVSWTLAGVALRQVLKEPVALRIFNITMGILLLLSLYPMLHNSTR